MYSGNMKYLHVIIPYAVRSRKGKTRLMLSEMVNMFCQGYLVSRSRNRGRRCHQGQSPHDQAGDYTLKNLPEAPSLLHVRGCCRLIIGLFLRMAFGCILRLL